MKKYTRAILACVSDTHSGHTLGLTNPETTLPDINGKQTQVTLNETQKYLWQVYSDGMEKTFALAGTDPIILMVLGDTTHGLLPELDDTKIANQIIRAKDVIMPWIRKNVKAVRLAKGTSVHVFGEGSAETLLELFLKQAKPGLDIKTLYHGLLQTLGISIDFAHTGPTTGKRVWLTGNECRYYLRSIMLQDIADGKKPPDLVLRGHTHGFVQEVLFQGEYESRMIVVPPMCIPNDWTRGRMQSPYHIINGVIAVEIINGHILATHQFVSLLDLRVQEEVLCQPTSQESKN